MNNGWYATAQRTTYIYTSNCPTGTYLVGGDGVLGGSLQQYQYFAKYYTNLPTHYYVRWVLTFKGIGSWDQNGSDSTTHNDAFDIGIDDLVVQGQSYAGSMFSSLSCGAQNIALSVKIFGRAPHSASSIYFKVISDLNEISTNEAFAFSNVKILFDANPPPFPETSYLCGRASNNLICDCPEGKYLLSGTCTNCHASCASCFGGTRRHCYECASGYSWNGYECVACTAYTETCSITSTTQPSLRCLTGRFLYPAIPSCVFDCYYPMVKATYSSVCTSDTCSTSCTGYIYWDQSCLTTCPSPYKQGSLPGGIKLCIYPCGSRDFLYWDGTCDDDCPAPLVSTTYLKKSLCTTPCSGTYLYPDSSCQSTCALPLVTRTVHSQILCTTPCNLPGEYLYQNGECSRTCAWPLTSSTTNGIKYCTYPCTGSNYLYWDGQCLSTCAGPLEIRIERGQRYCDYPTPTSQFLYWDGASSASCDPPLKQRIEGTVTIRKYCDYACPNRYQYLYQDGSCLNDCIFPWSKRLEKGVRFCDYPCTGSDSLYWNGTCHPSSACVAPLIAAVVHDKELCKFPDGNVSNFLYWDGTFSETCDPPLKQRIEGDPMVRKFCDNPCASPLPYLSWDGYCKSTCDPPFLVTSVGSKLFCSIPCSSLDLFLYDNGTCSDYCEFPYVSEFDGAGKFCHYPCSKTSLFYYYNSSCLSSCDAPFKVLTIEKVPWCVYPCAGDQFLFTNGTCADTCELPFNQYLGWDFKFCNNPCLADPLNPYLMWNGTCLPSCESPMRIDSSTGMGPLCYPPCDSAEEFYYVSTGECKAECDTSSIDKTGLYLKCFPPVYYDTTTFLDVLLEAPEDESVTLVTLAKMVQYTRYLDIGNLPSRLKRLHESRGRGIVTIRMGLEMPDSTRAAFTKYVLPDVFERYPEIHSNFLVNFWKEMTTWIIVIFVAILLIAVEEICARNEWVRAHMIIEKLRIIFKWNYLLILIDTSLADIILFSSLQFRTFNAHTSFAALSLEMTIAMVSLGVILLLGSYYVVRKIYLVKNSGSQSRQEISEGIIEWRGFQVFYRAFTENLTTNRLFYLIYAIRLCLPMLIASYLYVSPMTQTILYMIISTVTIGYIWLAKPIKRKLNYYQLMILEYFILVINICLFLLTVLSRERRRTSSYGIALGDIIIFCNSGIHVLLIVVLIVKVCWVLVAIFEYIRLDPKLRATEENPWPQIIVSILQQGGMGFEEIGFEGIEYDESEFENRLLITQKGINAKARSWDSVHQNMKRLSPGNNRKNPRVSKLFGGGHDGESDKLNTTESEDIGIVNKRHFYNSAADSPVREPRSPATTIPKTHSNPVHYNDYEENDDAELEFNGYQRKKQVNRIADFPEQGGGGAYIGGGGNIEERIARNYQEDVFIDPDIMIGMKMSHLKKMDLRSVDK